MKAVSSGKTFFLPSRSRLFFQLFYNKFEVEQSTYHNNFVAMKAKDECWCLMLWNEMLRMS